MGLCADAYGSLLNICNFSGRFESVEQMTVILTAILIGFFAWLAVLSAWMLYGVWQYKTLERWITKHTKWKSAEVAEGCLTGRKAVMTALVLFVLLEFFTLYIGQMNCSIYTKAKLELILVLVSMVSLIDYVRKIIPNILVFGTAGIRLVLLVPEYLWGENEFLAVLITDGIGFIVCFGLLFIAAVLSKKSIGFGDVKLFGAIGITLGIAGAYNTLFYSMVCALLAAIYTMVVRKKGRKYKMPFGPSVLFGYLFVLAFAAF